jgi:hypothetical protein
MIPYQTVKVFQCYSTITYLSRKLRCTASLDVYAHHRLRTYLPLLLSQTAQGHTSYTLSNELPQ